MRVALVSTYPPRRCGVATFTSDLMSAVHEADPTVTIDVAAIDERHVVRAYEGEVRWRISQGTAAGYTGAANAIAASDVDVVSVQHEFGLYGLWRDEGWEGDRWIEGSYEDHLASFLASRAQAHPRDPAHRPAGAVPGCPPGRPDLAAASDGLVVMAETAVGHPPRGLRRHDAVTVIQHGMPHIEPRGRRRLKEKMGLEGRSIISTFGLVGPGKGLEYVIEAMPTVAARHPDALYLIAGQTHPELLRRQGEEYRNKLIADRG